MRSDSNIHIHEHKFTAVSYFCGCGGFDLGIVGGFTYRDQLYPQNPIEIISAYDVNMKAVETYHANIGLHAHVRDLSDTDPLDIPRADILLGGFPCQDFAACGPRRGLNSKRGRLYRTMIDYAAHHRPMLIVGENVPGLLTIDGGAVLETILSDLRAIGYRPEVWRLNAQDHGVPQARTRLIITAVRSDLSGCPAVPSPDFRSGPRTAKWAIGDLEEVTDEAIPNQSQYFKAGRAGRGNGQGDEKTKADEPGYTVRANAKSRIQFHYSLPRRLTIRECARLQTFPDNFVFGHPATTSMMQIGNAVPPVLAHRLGRSITEWLSDAVSGSGVSPGCPPVDRRPGSVQAARRCVSREKFDRRQKCAAHSSGGG